MKKPVVFFAHGFDERRREHIDFFKECLCEVFGKNNVHEGDRANETTIGDATWKKINESDLVFAMFSKKDKCVSHGVIFETGYAKGKDIPVYSVKEEGINIDKIGMIQYTSPEGEDSASNIWPFPTDIGKLRKEKKEWRKKLDNIVMKAENKERAMEYICLGAKKTVTIFNGGYSVISCSRKIELKQATPRLSFLHQFSIAREVKGEIQPFDKMTARNPFEAFKNGKAFFAKEVVEVTKGKPPILNQKILDNKNNKEVFFYIEAKGPFQKKDIFSYEYAVGLPDIFPISEINPYSRFPLPSNKPKELTYRINFERKLFSLIKEEPSFVFRSSDRTSPTGKKEFFDRSDSALYASFTKSFPPATINLPSGSIKATWKWK